MFQSRARSPGSLTSRGRSRSRRSFRAVPNHLVLLRSPPPGDREIHFRAVSDYLVLLRLGGQTNASLGFRAVPDHLDLLHFAKVRSELGVSQPCQITLFTCRHLNTHPHTGTRATTTKDSQRVRVSPHAIRTHTSRPRRVLRAKRGRPSCCPRTIRARANRAGEVSGPLGRVLTSEASPQQAHLRAFAPLQPSNKH